MNIRKKGLWATRPTVLFLFRGCGSFRQPLFLSRRIRPAAGKAIYQGIRAPFKAMRYHSLAVSREHLPDCLTITAEAEDGEIMGIRHREYLTEGIQFHPESIMTPVGKRLLRNFLRSGTSASGAGPEERSHAQ